MPAKHVLSGLAWSRQVFASIAMNLQHSFHRLPTTCQSLLSWHLPGHNLVLGIKLNPMCCCCANIVNTDAPLTLQIDGQGRPVSSLPCLHYRVHQPAEAAAGTCEAAAAGNDAVAAGPAAWSVRARSHESIHGAVGCTPSVSHCPSGSCLCSNAAQGTHSLLQEFLSYGKA